VTQSTHSTIVDNQRRNKYYILPPDFETSKKYQPWPSRTLGATAGRGMNSHPTPGSLFAMGWLRLMAKDFIRFFKSAKKKYFIDGILFILFFMSSILDRLQHDHISTPLHSPPVARPFVF
jgi:hypothetical protein